MKAAIFGGGFGVYGYLPALIRYGATVVLSQKYYDRLIGRADLAPFAEVIEWRSDDMLLDGCNTVVIALAPYDQPAMVNQCLAHDSIANFFLEKPLAVTPQEAMSLLALLRESGRNFSIGYNFRLTSWGQRLLQQRKGAREIIWSFRAHHFTNDTATWKRDHDQGGGALRFYGIHLIALLTEMGYNSVIESVLTTDTAQWAAKFSGSDLPLCQIFINSNASNPVFSVKSDGLVFNMAQPFENTSPASGDDIRVPLLIESIKNLDRGDAPSYQFYEATNTLWHKVESKTTFADDVAR